MTNTETPGSAATAHRDVGGLVVALAVFAVTAIVAWVAHPGALERHIFWLGNDLPNGLHVPIEAAMQDGTLGAVAVVALIALAMRRARTALTVLVAGVGAWLIVPLLKRAIARPRPTDLLHDVVVRGHHPGGFGFPSGHTAVAFAVASALVPDLPRRVRPFVWILAVIVGFARVYVGAHFPLDVLGGAALGYAIGSGVRLGFRNLAR